MGHKELANRNENELVRRVLSWGNNPEIAMLRGQVAPARRADAYNLKFRMGQEKAFDVAISLTSDGTRFHLKRTTVPKIDAYCDVAKLITIGINAQSDWVSISFGQDMFSIHLKRLKATLRALGFIHPA